MAVFVLDGEWRGLIGRQKAGSRRLSLGYIFSVHGRRLNGNPHFVAKLPRKFRGTRNIARPNACSEGSLGSTLRFRQVVCTPPTVAVLKLSSATPS